MFKLIAEAYEALINPETRAHYDRYGHGDQSRNNAEYRERNDFPQNVGGRSHNRREHRFCRDEDFSEGRAFDIFNHFFAEFERDFGGDLFGDGFASSFFRGGAGDPFSDPFFSRGHQDPFSDPFFLGGGMGGVRRTGRSTLNSFSDHHSIMREEGSSSFMRTRGEPSRMMTSTSTTTTISADGTRRTRKEVTTVHPDGRRETKVEDFTDRAPRITHDPGGNDTRVRIPITRRR